MKYIITSLSPEIVDQQQILILDGEKDKEFIHQQALEFMQNSNEEELLKKINLNNSSNLSLLSFPQLTVALTGCSSFLGSHILFILLNLGYPFLFIF